MPPTSTILSPNMTERESTPTPAAAQRLPTATNQLRPTTKRCKPSQQSNRPSPNYRLRTRRSTTTAHWRSRTPSTRLKMPLLNPNRPLSRSPLLRALRSLQPTLRKDKKGRLCTLLTCSVMCQVV
ncbi:MAG: hypothetical protein [Microviridae sp.]|nr:MAG: hypothetical protein [Microviridae sp.]